MKRPRRGDGSRSGSSYAVTLLTPVQRGAESRLAEHLRGLGIGAESPLARLPSVHFARWLMIDQLRSDWPGAPSPPPRLNSQYLLFTASLTAPGPREAERLPGAFLDELRTRIPAAADAIWGHCVGYPGTSEPEAFVRYLAASQLETSLFHVGYADVTVDEVRHALGVRDKLVAFARDHQGQQDMAELQRAYLGESATWSP